MKTTAWLALPLAAVLAACGTASAPAGSSEATAGAARTPLGSVAPPPSVLTAPTLIATAAAVAPTASSAAFAELVRSLSEPDSAFISDNIISNETSYLQVAPALARATPGGAYLGVGPEQNFTYLALTRPRVAFILDIRRQNLVEHLLYKAIFAEATTRAHFLALLVGRPFDAAGDPGPGASIEAVLAHAEKTPPDEAFFAKAHTRLRAAIERELPLDASDKKTLELTHRAFFRAQLDVRFELKQSSGRRYPTLRELLAEKDPEGVARGFLAGEEAFRFVQGMERDGRIIPVVGDFAGDRAMPGIAAYLAREELSVTAFYVSNVEQYLFEPKVWPRWARNVAALPTSDGSVFIRAYLDQGRHHPAQLKGHRTATVLQRVGDFEERQARKPYGSFWEVANEKAPADG